MLMKGSIGKAVDEYVTICKQLEELTQRKEEIKEYLSRHKPFQNVPLSEYESLVKRKAGILAWTVQK